MADGVLRGEENAGVRTFFGIPYAAAPVGALRFRAPAPVAKWAGVLDALGFAARAPQPDVSGRKFIGAEDCLYLNVYAPEDAGPHPVLVWIHGGGGVMGAAQQYDARRFAENGVVVVTIGYRLGVLGMLYLEDPTLPELADTNVSLRDQLAALRWVRDNIAEFGGDPARVTLAGQSNGGRTVGTLLPLAGGLFQQAIVQSGTGVGAVVHTPEQAERVTQAVLAELDVPARQLKELPVERILLAQQRVALASGTMVTYRLVLDGDLLPRRPLDAIADGAASGVALLIGTTANEQDLFRMLQRGGGKLLGSGSTMLDQPRFERMSSAYRDMFPDWPAERIHDQVMTAGDWWLPAIRFAQAQYVAGGDAWMYRLDARLSPNGLGAPHILDLLLMFDDIDNPNWRFLLNGSSLLFGREAERARLQALAGEMHAAWVRFISTGDPGWPPYDPPARATMIFNDTSTVIEDPDSAERLLWS